MQIHVDEFEACRTDSNKIHAGKIYFVLINLIELILLKYCRQYFSMRARKEQEAAARAIDEARAEVGGVVGDSDDDTAPPNGFDDILNEVC